MADEAERKYEEISRKLAMVEHDLERAEDLGDNNSSKLKAAEVEISRLTEGKFSTNRSTTKNLKF